MITAEFRVLKSLHCDVFLGAHGSYYDLEAKHAKLSAAGTAPTLIQKAIEITSLTGNRHSFPNFRGKPQLRKSSDSTQYVGTIAICILLANQTFSLGLTAAAANVFGGAIIVQRNWERRYLRYFVALGAGSCWQLPWSKWSRKVWHSAAAAPLS